MKIIRMVIPSSPNTHNNKMNPGKWIIKIHIWKEKKQRGYGLFNIITS